MFDKPKFVDPTTRASLPGRTKVDLLVWIRCFPAKTAPRLVRLALILAFPLVFVIATPGSGWGIAFFSAILLVAQALPLWKQIVRVQEHFNYGCLNPAQVISIQPYMIAVYSDLGMHEGSSWPVVKILTHPLEKVRGRRMQIGDRLPTVSLYSGFRGRPHWDDFQPIAVNCVTDDETAVRDALWRLNQRSDEDVWGDLKKCLASVPQPYQPGLYWMKQS